MRKAAPEFEQRDIARLGRSRNLGGVAHEAIEIPLGIAMQVPIRRVEWYLDPKAYTCRLKDLGEEHQTIGATAFDAAHVVVRCTQPSLGLGDNLRPPAHTAVSGVGI